MTQSRADHLPAVDGVRQPLCWHQDVRYCLQACLSCSSAHCNGPLHCYACKQPTSVVDMHLVGHTTRDTTTWSGRSRRYANMPVSLPHPGCAHSWCAAAGDEVSHLRWRIMHGEIFQKQPPAVIVVHIGTNDLGEPANLHPVCLWATCLLGRSLQAAGEQRQGLTLPSSAFKNAAVACCMPDRLASTVCSAMLAAFGVMQPAMPRLGMLQTSREQLLCYPPRHAADCALLCVQEQLHAMAVMSTSSQLWQMAPLRGRHLLEPCYVCCCTDLCC